jgi:adenylate cyclase
MTSERMDRRLLAILAADVAGYSRLVGADEEGTLAQWKAHFRELIEPKIAEHHGRIVRVTGDGLLVEFVSVIVAVKCAIELQHAMGERNIGLLPEKRIEFRMGINVGDIIIDGTDMWGGGVNVAARLEALAEPGGICISGRVQEDVQGKLDITFEDMGEQRLKNIASPVRVYRVSVEASAKTRPALPLPHNPSLAVLPFNNMSGDPEQEYFADGMVDDIIAGLARIKWLFVISRNSSFVYKNRPKDVKQIGRELGVRYVTQGSVRKVASRVRIAVQLIDAEKDTHLWVDRYDREITDIFALQDEISVKVIEAIEPNLRNAEIERVRRARTASLEAYDLVLRAQPFALSHIAEEAVVAIPLLTRAIELDPKYASAHARLALCYHSRFSRAGLCEDDRAAAIRHAHAAIASGADDAAALGIAGFVVALDAHDYPMALDAFDRALALSNSNFFALSSSALALSWMGTAEVAIERAHRALRLSPFDPLNFMSYNALAISYLHMRQFDQAHAAAEQSVRLSPRFSVSRALLTAALSQLGRDAEAAEQARQVLDLDPGFSVHRFSVTVDIEPSVFAPIAEAWRKAGLPER